MSIVSDFFMDIGNFFRGGSVLGIDIGTVSIKAVELAKKGETFSIANYGILGTTKYLNAANQAIQTSSLKISERDATDLLKTLIREMNPKTRLVVASIPSFTSFTTVLDMPLLSSDETSRSVLFQAQQYIPIPIKDVAVEWFSVNQYEGSQGQKFQRILLVGIPNDVVAVYKKIYKNAGLRLVSIELEQFALVRALKNFFSDAPTLLVDIGAQSTDIAIIEKGMIQEVEQTDYSGVYLTQALAKSLDVSMFRAEELKRRRGLSAFGADSELSTLLLPFLDVIIQETRHAKDVYERRYGKKIEKLMLVGGGSNLIGIEKYFSSQIGLTLSHHSVFTGFEYPPSIEPAIKGLGNELAIALGLAQKYFS